MSYQAVLKRGTEFLKSYNVDTIGKKFGRKAAFVATGLFAKTFLNYGYTTRVTNLDIFLEAYRQAQIENRGLVTVMNHTSVLDEPFCWGILPNEHLLNPQHMRWTLGADNICFKNKFLSAYFSSGQVLSTKRFGAGIFQGSIDASVTLLSPDLSKYTIENEYTPKGENSTARWVHMFPEALVHQVEPPFNNTLKYFKWGVSRLILESTRPPIVVPFFTKGLEHSLPEDNPLYFPKTGLPVEYNVGDPMDDKLIQDYRRQWFKLTEKTGKYDKEIPDEVKTGPEAEQLRSQVASSVRDAVMQAREFYENLPLDDPRFNDPEFWHLSDEDKGVWLKKNKVGRHL